IALATGSAEARSAPETAYRAAEREFKRLVRATPAPKRHEFERAVAALETARLDGAKEPWADEALFQAARLRRRLAEVSGRAEDWEDAAAAFERSARVYTQSSLADDAWYLAGEIYEKYIRDPRRAADAYREVVRTYPKGDMVRRSERALAALGAPAVPLPSLKASTPLSPEAAEAASEGATLVTGLRTSSSKSFTRVVVDLSGPTTVTAHALKPDPATNMPPRIYMDLSPARLAEGVADIEIGDQLLQRARAGQNDRDTVRIVVDVVSSGEHSVIQLDNPWRVVLDVWGDKGRQPRAPARVATATPPDVGAPPPPKGRVATKDSLLVVIDAGHGGKDPGAIGNGGLREADVVLRLAKRVAERVDRLPGLRTKLTRSTDVFLPLEQRTAIANQAGADLFVSIHANASTNRDASGMETYYMDNTTDHAAAKLARRENAVSTRAMNDLQMLFRALRIDSNVVESSRLAESVQGAMGRHLSGKYHPLPDHGVKKALFFVLFNAEMPAILVETAFITNARDARLLRRSAFQDEMADSIAEGLQRYLKEAPPVLSASAP
ncbi:MAG: N-acetylmuramoyl-L-alanine amidase, partial [Myxococcales bacterium]|nr:N-acetylmuramoyl-L-alanine amidase [Myxococcales bacterium]